jgi:hypothetical protein
VDSTGLIHILCEATKNLLVTVPDARRTFSKEHCVALMRQPVNLYVDGSHHTGSKYDHWQNRNGIPWGALLNSSHQTGIAANCELRWLPSPAFESIREASRTLGNGNNLQEYCLLPSISKLADDVLTHADDRDSFLPDATFQLERS